MRVWLLALCLSLLSGLVRADGEQAFGAHRSRCHAPIEIKRRLHGDWSGRTADQLFLTTRQTMPGESPGSLSDEAYLDVVAYMLDLAGVPRPDGALTETMLVGVTIEGRDSGRNCIAGDTDKSAQQLPGERTAIYCHDRCGWRVTRRISGTGIACKELN